ncbi:TPA: hypothetical protein NBM92_005174 [Klebsiella oxytoca]|nr:hypothetical protein [Klebsiella oxytoca]
MLRHTLQQSERGTGTEKKRSGFVSGSGDVPYGAEEAVVFRKQEMTLCSDEFCRQSGDRFFVCDEPGKPGLTRVTPGDGFAAG